MPHDPLSWIADELAGLDRQGLRRRLVVRPGKQGPTALRGSRTLVNFASNDYLALAADPRLVAAAQLACQSAGWGAGASPLISGYGPAHAELEARLAKWLGCEAALVFSSGYAANVGAIAALVGRGDVVLADAKNHASLIDGCRLSRAEVVVYPHCDMAALAERLQSAAGFRRRLIVSDSLFSMDGDIAPLVDLAMLAERHDAMLLVDEAHATGVFGPRGSGLAEEQGVAAAIQVRVGTLSKALGSAGGFVAGSQLLVDWLTNRARTYVFSTAHPAAASAAALTAIEIVLHEPQHRAQLLQRAGAFRESLAAAGWNTLRSASQIVPLVVGEPAATLRLAELLAVAGFWVPGIRPPSVPAGESLLRVSLSYGHTVHQLEELSAQLRRLRSTLASI